MQKIYFQSTPLFLSATKLEGFTESDISYTWDPSAIRHTIRRLQGIDSPPILVIQENIESAIELLKEQFKVIQAGGGLTVTPNDEILLIFRRGKWDLPKGKLDEGETIEECAVREVEEETGLQQVSLGRLLQKTYHTYVENGDHILKETFWYAMQTGKQDLQPQTEEDIQECRWVPATEVSSFFTNMQPSVKDVIEAYLLRKE